MRFKATFVALAVMALAAVSLAQAQGQGNQARAGARQGQGGMRGMQGMGRAQGLTQLLRNAQVQTELKLTDDQKAKIQAMPRPQRGGGGNGGGGGQRTPPTVEEQMKQLADDKAATSAILTPEQETRLEQIRVQWAGPNAVMLPDVAVALGITADQKTKLTELQTKMGTANRDLFTKVQNGEVDQQAAMATVQKNQETMKAEVEKVLTDEQKTKLKAMGGTELKMEMQRGRGGPGGGGNTPPPQA